MHKKTITYLSIIIPVLVALIFNIKLDIKPLTFLPPIYALLNAITSILLVVALVAIKQNKKTKHEILMKICLLFSALFLILYMLYHISSESTKFEGEGILETFYYIVLISHIILSIIVIPFVLISFSRAINNQFESHKKIARIAYPLWLYVTVSGVIVYILISPYY